jgi:hypothetical protein
MNQGVKIIIILSRTWLKRRRDFVRSWASSHIRISRIILALKTRYSMFGFQDAANLDEGAKWPAAFALKELIAAEE